MNPFAIASDLEARYPVVLNDAEESRVTVLLGAASRQVRHRVKDIDLRTDIDSDLIKDIVCEMVWMAISAVHPGARQESRTVGSVSTSVTFDGAAGKLKLTRDQLSLLTPVRAKARASAKDTLPAPPLNPRYDHSYPYGDWGVGPYGGRRHFDSPY